MAKSNVIKIESANLNDEDVQTVNARDLHAGLEIGKDFSTWVKDQIDRARLVEHRDFEVFTQKGENPLGGRPMQEYYFTVDAAKHIAMMSNTDKGFEIREYFIAVEKDYKALLVSNAKDQAMKELPDYDRMRRLARTDGQGDLLKLVSKRFMAYARTKLPMDDLELDPVPEGAALAALEFYMRHAKKLLSDEEKKSKLPPGMVLSQLPNWK